MTNRGKDGGMQRRIVALLVVGALCGATAAEAQTVADWIEPVWDAEKGVYAYGPVYWDLDVAPRSAESDEFSFYMYYNRAAALMAATVACRRDEEFEIYARSFSGEHFLSLTTGLVPGRECVLFLVGGSDKNERLAYRMTVGERVTRRTDEREVRNARPRVGRAYNAGPPTVGPIVSRTLDRLARALHAERGE